MRPKELRRRLVNLVPVFDAQLESECNDHRESDGSFTLHGLCSEFSSCFREHYQSLTDHVLAELFDFIESLLVEPDAEENSLDNALCTCFLENISSEPCGQFAKPWMGRKTRAFFDHWHQGPPY